MSYTNATAGNASSIEPFDHHKQNVTFLAADGITEINTPMGEINHYIFENSKQCILFGSQMGACIIMAIVLVVLTSSKKRLQPLFLLNLASLVLGFLRALFLALYFVSQWVEFYNQYSRDYTDLSSSTYRTSVVATLFPVLMTITINGSLIIQAHAVCKIMDKKFAIPLVGASIIVVLLTIGFRFALCVTNIQAIVGAVVLEAQYLRTATLVTSTLSIWWFSLLFIYKLIFTMYTRFRNGWKRWGAFRILSIMAGCTMIIPSVFAILNYVEQDRFPEAGTLALTTTALLLPLSSLWATMAADQEDASIRESIRAASQASRGSDSNTRVGSQSSAVMGTEERKGSVAPLTSNTIDTVIGHAPPTSARDSTELDLERMGVRVDRSYSINAGAR